MQTRLRTGNFTLICVEEKSNIQKVFEKFGIDLRYCPKVELILMFIFRNNYGSYKYMTEREIEWKAKILTFYFVMT